MKSQPLPGSGETEGTHSARDPEPSVGVAQAASNLRGPKGKKRKPKDDDDDAKFSGAPQPTFNTRGSSSRRPQAGNRFAFLAQGQEEEED